MKWIWVPNIWHCFYDFKKNWSVCTYDLQNCRREIFYKTAAMYQSLVNGRILSWVAIKYFMEMDFMMISIIR